MTRHDPQSTLVRSYLTLRKSIGVIGIVLPFVLAAGALIVETTAIQRSISHYYHTGMRDVFVGSLCAIAVFLWSYRGYERRDSIAGNLACIFALGVALFPVATDPEQTPAERLAGWLHVFSAAAFFLTLAYFSLRLFRLSDKVAPTHNKILRNRIYSACGYAILLCLVAMLAAGFVPEESTVWTLRPIFWLQATAIVAFGVSWFVKGETILKDEIPRGADVAVERTMPRIPEGRPVTPGR